MHVHLAPTEGATARVTRVLCFPCHAQVKWAGERRTGGRLRATVGGYQVRRCATRSRAEGRMTKSCPSPLLFSQNRSRRTLLLTCCDKQLWGLVPDLLKADADPNVRLVSPRRVLSLRLAAAICLLAGASSCTKRQARHVLMRRPRTIADVQAPTWGATPLHMACEGGDLPAVRALVAAGAHMDVLARYAVVLLHATITAVEIQTSPLACAARHGHADVVAFLLDSGADAELGDDSDDPVRAPVCSLIAGQPRARASST